MKGISPENTKRVGRENPTRADSVAVLRELIGSKAGIFADRATRRAALNLMQDAVDARELAERENEERLRADAALVESKEQFRIVSESGLVAISFFTADGKIVDANDAFLELVGYSRTDLEAGEIRWDKLTPPEWVPRMMSAVQEYRKNGRIDLCEAQYCRKDGLCFWGLFGGRRIESTGQGVAFVLDISERKRAEAEVRQSEERQAFLLKLSDALRPLGSPLEVQAVAGRFLGEYLGANRVGYAEDEEDEIHARVPPHYTIDVPGIEGRHRYADYGGKLNDDFRAGRTIVRPDIANDPLLTAEEKKAHAALQLGATLYVPLVKGGHLVAVLFVHYREAHAFSQTDVALVQEVAERTWATVERARAEEALAADLRATEVLREFASRRIAETDMQPLYDDITATAIKLTRAQAGTVQVFDPETRELVLLSTHGFPPDSPRRFGRIDADSATSCGRALRSGQRTFLDFDDPSLEDSNGDLGWHVKVGYRSAQSTPLVSRSGHPIGMLTTHWHDSGHRPSERELRYLDILAGQAADLIERRAAEEALGASRERLRILVDSALEHAIISMDLQRKITSWNPGAERIFGYAAEEIIGQTADNIFTVEDRALDVPGKEMKAALETGRAGDNRWQRRKDGTRFWANGAMLPMRASFDGEIIGFVKILRDETEIENTRQNLSSSRLALEMALAQTRSAQSQAEAASKAKDHFLAVLSHELRTPLTPVLMAASMLQEDDTLTAPEREALQMIERNILLEARLVDDLLDVTRIGRGKMELSMVPMDVHTAIEYAVEVCLPDVAAKNHRLNVSLKAKRHQRKGDQARLQQAIWNLLKNACKFTPDGGEITLQTWNQGSNILISINDSGIGLEPEAATRIFDPFVQANDGITRSFGGLGLGLAISKAIVEAHGGTISAESKGRDQGTTFEISLPLSA